jgi:hypothetical protein
MSVWVYLENNDGPVPVARHEEGGTYALGGIEQAELNVTYNYSPLYRLALRSYTHDDTHGSGRPYGPVAEIGLWHWIDGRSGRETAECFKAVLSELDPRGHNRPVDDYWAPTPSNAAAPIVTLLSWANEHPDAKWRISG